jgi:4-hydroxybenzoyl-CoA thioesterase
MQRKTVRYDYTISFGDCDPAGIVFYPNYSRWMDASSVHFFKSCGLPHWREMQKTNGILGTPLLEIHTKFNQPATYGQTLQIYTSVSEWRAKVFIHKHVVMRGEDLICEGEETRVFGIQHPEDPNKIKAVAIPEEFKRLCEFERVQP